MKTGFFGEFMVRFQYDNLVRPLDEKRTYTPGNLLDQAINANNVKRNQ
jgi:hypothetical protein